MPTPTVAKTVITPVGRIPDRTPAPHDDPGMTEVTGGSGTGELSGLSGDLQIARSPEGVHTYSFAYEQA